MTTTLDVQLTSNQQVAALHAYLAAQGVGGCCADEGLSVSWDAATGVVTVAADRDVTDLVKDWTPPPTRDERIAGATTIEQLKSALLDGGA